ncbi:hypothetical protein KR018_008081 [Drosophila ironensis]|nr:hypothetical protein KR018_008081 [Drosophila ironensis]
MCPQINARLEFTNVICECYDKSFCEIELCQLKSVNRTYKYFSGRFNLRQSTSSNIKINVALFKRFNGYKPFLYNVTVDMCKFMKNRKANPVANFVYESFANFSNFNHSCPFNHGILIEKLPIEYVNHRLSQVLSFPEGDYAIEGSWIRSGFRAFFIKLFYTIFVR